MNILLISDVYFPRVNGVSTSIRTFVYQLQQLGHQVTLIAPDYPAADHHQVTADEAWIMRIPARGLFFDPEDRLMKMGEVLDKVQQLQRQQFDIIHVHTPFVAHMLGLRLGKLLSIPVVETYHTFFEDYLHLYLPIIPKRIARAIARLISRRQCNAVDGVISPSQPMLDVLRQYGVQQYAEVIPTGLQQQSFATASPEKFRQAFAIAKERPMALYVGRVAYEKNISFLIDMWQHVVKQMPEALLVIAGEGPAEKSLQQQCAKLGLNQHIQFIGYLDRNTMLNACYRAADVFVFSSLSETQGLVLIEAMAQATPVVAIAELGTKSILIEGQGAHISPLDSPIFAARVLNLLRDKTARQALGRSAQRYVKEHWTDAVQAKKLVKFYQQVVQHQTP
ncbi:MAG: glycosyltransferase [Methylophilaceae bacterium]